MTLSSNRQTAPNSPSAQEGGGGLRGAERPPSNAELGTPRSGPTRAPTRAPSPPAAQSGMSRPPRRAGPVARGHWSPEVTVSRKGQRCRWGPQQEKPGACGSSPCAGGCERPPRPASPWTRRLTCALGVTRAAPRSLACSGKRGVGHLSRCGPTHPRSGDRSYRAE